MHKPDYRVIEHPADIGCELRATSRRALYEDAALVYYDMVVGLDHIRAEVEAVLEVDGSDDEDLLVGMLSRLLVETEVEERIYREAHVEDLQGFRLRLRLRGEPIDPERHPFQFGIKAITYHQLSVRENSDGSWSAQVMFDI